LSIKRKRNSKEKNIKSRKIDKRKRKMFSPYADHNRFQWYRPIALSRGFSVKTLTGV